MISLNVLNTTCVMCAEAVTGQRSVGEAPRPASVGVIVKVLVMALLRVMARPRGRHRQAGSKV